MEDLEELLPNTTSPSNNNANPSCCNNKKVRLAVEGCSIVASSLLFFEVFHNPMCGLVFNCGCSFNPWLGGTGWQYCNVHNPNLSSPRCPWCISPRDTPSWTWATGKTFVVIGMVGAWLLVGWYIKKMKTKIASSSSSINTSSESYLILHERKACHIRRRIAPICWFVFHHVVSGLIFALATGYPYFLFFTFANHQRKSAPLAPVLPNVTTVAA